MRRLSRHFVKLCIWGFALALPVQMAESAPEDATVTQTAAWRRTVNGWEDRQYWIINPPPPLPTATKIHPAVVGSLQFLMSLAALLALPTARRS